MRSRPWRHAGLIAAALLTPLALINPAAAAEGSWSDRLSDLTGASQLAGSGRGITVAVLDTWVDNAHPDFGNRVSAGVSCSDGTCIPGGNQPDTCEPHGTHVTGIVASTRYGVAPLANVLPIRVLSSHSGACVAQAADVALGIRYALSQHIKIINVSLGSTFPLQDPRKVLPAAVTAATKAGSLVIVAAGNGRATAVQTYGKDALTVAALAPSGNVASYSQQGTGVDIAAPGGDAPAGNCDPALCVVSTWQDGGYASDAGTSMAAPFVSGTAALLLSQNPKRGIADVRKTILTTTRPLPGAGAGKLDILAAVQLRAPKGKLPQTGSDSNSGALATSAPQPKTTHSITPAPGAGAPAAVKTRTSSPAAASTTSTRTSSDSVHIGAVQILGMLIVGGVGIAFVGVINQRTRRQN